MEFYNPFSTDRAEFLGDNLFEFFANSERFEGLLNRKSTVVRGGRGSGKTMFLLYNSYFHKKRKSFSEGHSMIEFLGSLDLIGVHFRADTNFVTAFREKGQTENEWVDLFGHYINIYVSKRLCGIVTDINQELFPGTTKIELENSEVISILLDSEIHDYPSLIKVLDRKEVELLRYINNIGREERPLLIGQGLLFNLIAKSILAHDLLKGLTIHFFVDEYENLLEYQQQYINTYIKHPEPVVFDIGMRNEGFKTYKTLGDSETIDSPHDFDYFDIDEFSDTEYESFLFETCKKRLRRHPDLSKLSEDSELLDIRFYLATSDINSELNASLGESGINKLKDSLSLKLQDKESVLLGTDDPILLGLHRVLIERGNSETDVTTEFEKYSDGQPSKYNDWIHNNKNGLVYLLLKEVSKSKMYYGFNMYKQLSSGIIRYFIELCESAFKNAYREGFDFGNPRPLTPKEQTTASNYVSRYKVSDIEHYSPYSSQLKRFIILLGNIFERLHRDPKLSEPEKNHFSTDYEKLSDEAKIFLKSACLYSCLQKRRVTKEKSSSIDSNEIEFHLNHIYAPYFKISPRRMRKLDINHRTLETLMLGNATKAEATANRIAKIGNGDEIELEQLKIFE